MPTLEVVTHRLNLFKSKLNKVDYLEILSKESLKDKFISKAQEKEKQEKEKKESL
jgi:hypothetical protein